MRNNKKVFLFRHGETNLNVDGIVMGQNSNLNTYFTENGYRYINELKNKLLEEDIDIIYSSDYDRTRETALIANKYLNLPIVITKKLRGLNMGKYQGVSMDEFLNNKNVIDCFNNYDLKFENGESINDLNKRVYNFIMNLCINTRFNNIALITHSAVISNLKSFLLNESYSCLNGCELLYNGSDLEVIRYWDSDNSKYDILPNNDLLNNNNYFLVRHGDNVDSLTIANNDLSLSDLGILQANGLAKTIGCKFDVVFASISKRAIMTANIIAPNCDIICDERLLERGFGSNHSDGLETESEVNERIISFLIDIKEKFSDKNILIVTHGSLIKVIQNILEKTDIKRGPVNNCDCVKYSNNRGKVYIKNKIF